MPVVKRLTFTVCVLIVLVTRTTLASRGCDVYVPDDFPTIQAAIDAAGNEQTICVRQGIYYETIDMLGKDLTLRALEGPEVTVIDAFLSGTAVLCVNGEDANTVIDGFTITNGLADNGGGMVIVNASPTVRNCIFTLNEATNGGGDAAGGGGMRVENGEPLILNCTFRSNDAADNGAGILCLNASPTLVNCVFRDHKEPDGAGMYNFESNPVLINCLFYNNEVTQGVTAVGGGIANVSNSAPVLYNCTFADNYARDEGGGIYNGPGCTATLNNCILWGNSVDQIFDYDGVPASVRYSCVEGGWPGEGNIDQDPRFINPASGNFRLGAGSPCVDAGDSTAVPSDVLVDLHMNGRFADDRQVEDVGVPFGIPPVVVDMGAYERRGCPWDIDGDGDVDTADLLALLAYWGARP
jgi:hypothetical protein